MLGLDWIRKKTPFGKTKIYNGGCPQEHTPLENTERWFYDTERMEKEMYLLVDCALAKIKLEALKREGPGEYASFKASVLEVNGLTVSRQEREEKAESFRSRDHAPSPEEQQDVLCRALDNFGIHGKISKVTESYALGHLKVLELRRRIGKVPITKTAEEQRR